jgi:hypothetical protein
MTAASPHTSRRSLTAARQAAHESIRAFAGERWQEAVIDPDEEHLLKDTWIGHYEVLRIPGSE